MSDVEEKLQNLDLENVETHSDFEAMIKYCLKYEGGFVNDPDDAGGATNLGWTLGTAQQTRDLDIFDVDGDGDIDVDDIKKLTPEIAVKAYKKYFYDALDLDEFPSAIAFLLLDMSINHGLWRALIIFARAFNRMQAGTYDVEKLKLIKSFSKLKETVLQDMIDRISNHFDIIGLANAIVDARIQFYYDIVNAKPVNKKFLKGWLKRAEATREHMMTL